MPVSKTDKWVNLATALITGADDAILREELRWTLDDFFQTSYAWQETLPSFTVDAGTVTTNMTTQAAMTNQVVCYVDQVFAGTTPIPFVRDIGNVSDVDDVADKLAFVTNLTPDTVRWVPVSTTDTPDVVARVAYYSTNYDVTLPDFIIGQYKDIVLSGLYGRMYAHNNKPYSDQTKSLFYMKTFRAGCIRLRDIAMRGFNPSDRMWNFPSFARGRNW